MYIYESHTGGLYASNKYYSFDDLYCEQCGDYDWFIGEANSKEEALDLLMDYMDLFDPSLCNDCPHYGDYDYCDNDCENYSLSGGYSRDYVQSFIDENWDN